MQSNKYSADLTSMVLDFITLFQQQSNWELVSDSPTIKVYRMDGKENCFKVIAELGVTAETAFDMLANIEMRPKWDEICEKANVIEEIDGGTSIGYMKTRGIWPTSPRDATTLAIVQTLPNGDYLNVTRSISHPAHPENTGIVRMHCIIGGQVVSRIDDKRCRIVQIVDGDLKGWIPGSVLSYIATKAIPMSFNTLFNILLKESPKTESLLIKKCQGAFKVPLDALLSPDLIEDDIITTPEEKDDDIQLVSKTETTAIVKRKPGKLSKIIGLFKFVKMVLDGGHSFISLLVLILVWKNRKTLQ